MRAAHTSNLRTASPDRRCAHRFFGTCIEKQSEMRTYNTTCQRYKVRYDDGQVFAVPPARELCPVRAEALLSFP